MKAIQCQEEEGATLLLEGGADPNIMDIDSCVHYAAIAQNTAIAVKLLLHKAHMGARSKDDLTPLLLAVYENNQQSVAFLVQRNANECAVDKVKRTALTLDESSDTVRLFLQQVVGIFSQDTPGWTGKEYAYFRGFKFNLKLLSDYKQGNIKSLLKIAI